MPILQIPTSISTVASWADNDSLTVGGLLTPDAVGATADVTITSGDSTTAASGDIVMTIGSAGTTDGTIRNVGRVTTTDGVSSGTVRVVGGRASVSVADSAAVTNTTSETAYDQTYSIPANTLKAGSTVRVKAVVRFTNTVGATTATLAGRIGGTDIVTSSAVDVADNDVAMLDFWIVTRAAPGAAVDTEGAGFCIFDSGAAGAISTATSMANGVTLATNGALVVDVTCTYSVADATSSILVALLVDVI